MPKQLRKNPFRRSKAKEHYKQTPSVRALQKRIIVLERAIKRLVRDMRNPELIKEYTDIVENRVERRLIKENTSDYEGVSLFKGYKGDGDYWRCRIELSTGKEITEYYRDEVEAALRHDELVLEHMPSRTYLLNFIPDGWEEKDCLKPPNVPEKRKYISRYGTPELIKKVQPSGLGYVTSDECDILIEYIEKHADQTLQEWYEEWAMTKMT